MSDENEPREWRENREAYLKARAQAGTLEGTAYARRLEAMRPAEEGPTVRIPFPPAESQVRT
jgi:hypothetical protein